MDSTWLVLLSLVLGLMVGAGIVMIVRAAAGHGDRAATATSPSVPDGIDHVLDVLDTAAVVLDPSGNVMKASASAYTLGIVSGGVLVHDELRALVDRLRRDGGEPFAEVRLLRGSYGDASIELSARVARLGTRYTLLLADDRTEARRLESVRRDFIANISHELKTPIGAVGLLAEALEFAAGDPEQVRRFARQLSEESQRLVRITGDIIELSRLEATDTVANAKRVSMAEIVSMATEQNRVTASARGIELAVGKPVGAMVMGESTLLVAAVHNLVANAIRYSPDGSRVGIGMRERGEVVEVAITDQGAGIAEDEIDRVFERFYRVDQARSRQTGGTGLGLSIVKHAVANHGGDVRVWSRPGHGSTFTIQLPISVDTHESTTPQKESTS